MPLWSDSARRDALHRKIKAQNERVRAANQRRANRKHAIDHPVSHLLGKLTGR